MAPQLPEKVTQLQKVPALLSCSGPSTKKIWKPKKKKNYRIPVVPDYFLILLEEWENINANNLF